MATAKARATEAAHEADAAGLDAEAARLTEWLTVAEEKYIAALEQRDRDAVKQLEKEIKEVTEKRDGCVAVSDRMRQEMAARRRTQNLIMLVWSSSFAQPLELAEVAVIGHRAATSNRRLGVTGALLFSLTSGQFFQLLEGDADDVDGLFSRICEDKRHRDVTVLRRQSVDGRRFPQWAMHTLNLQDFDKEEQPVQTLLSVITQHAVIANACMQGAMRQALIKGGNPLFLQPKRSKAITVMIAMHQSDLITAADCSPTMLADTLNCYVDTCSRCIAAHGGSLIRVSGTRLHAQWQYTQLARVTEAALDVVAAVKELRAVAVEKAEASTALFSCIWPCVAVSAGTVVVTRHSTHAYTTLDAVGPAVSECEGLLQAGLAAGSQMVVSMLVATSLASVGRLHFQEIDSSGRATCLTVSDISGVPASAAGELAGVLEVFSGGEKDKKREPPPIVDAAGGPEEGSRRTRPGRSQTHELPRDLEPVERPAFTKNDVSNVLLTDAELQKQFEMLDTNKNGWLSKEEFRDFFEHFDSMGIYDMHDRIDDVLSDYNLLGDDRLSYDEFCVLMLKLAQH
eukprot:TRINITY_DN11970_c0_g1_i1.p1 TRINITY_DN11970_c0_g1~~TRINITY_DN11970_c0_g1_i1.p1  ORF type:complete len:584 (+),score=208.46 TRINITY_DN11970_c0_g1_i1:48-1754(+)